MIFNNRAELHAATIDSIASMSHSDLLGTIRSCHISVMKKDKASMHAAVMSMWVEAQPYQEQEKGSEGGGIFDRLLVDSINEILKDGKIIKERAKEAFFELDRPKIIEVRKGPEHKVEVGRQHQLFETLLQIVSCGLNVYMVGPAGSGKTEAARATAKAMDAKFIPMSLGPQTMRSEIFGYMNATGDYVATSFRDLYESGGVILLDELDRCNPRVSISLNAAIENKLAVFPDGVVEMHKDTVILGAGNTRGHGADNQYITASQQDLSFLERFAILEWPYDLGFEEELVRSVLNDETKATAWIRLVREVRKLIDELSLRYSCSPRRAIQGAKMISNGINRKIIFNTILFGGWSPDDTKKAINNSILLKGAGM